MKPHEEKPNKDNGQPEERGPEEHGPESREPGEYGPEGHVPERRVPEGRDEIADELLLAEYGDELFGGRLSEEEEREVDEFRERMRTTLDYEERRRIFKEWRRKRERAGRKRSEILGFCEAGARALGRPELRDMYVRLEWTGNREISPAIEREFADNWLYRDDFDFERTEGLMEAGVLDPDGMHWHPEPQEPNPPVRDLQVEEAFAQATALLWERFDAEFAVEDDEGRNPEVDAALRLAPPEAIEEMRGRPHSARLLRKYLRAHGVGVAIPEKMEVAERWLAAWLENR